MSNFKYEGPGDYRTRNGSKVYVGYNIEDTGVSLNTNYPLVGHTELGHSTWMSDGKGVFEREKRP